MKKTLLGLAILLVIVLLLARAAGPQPAGKAALRLNGIEVAYPSTIKDGSDYHTSGLRFAGIARGEHAGVWSAELSVRGPLGTDNEPLHCSAESAMIVTGGTWALRTRAGEIRGQVVEGKVALRPDFPIIGRCTGPVPATLTIDVTSATGVYQSVRTLTIQRAIIDHRVVPATIVADVTLVE